jgi:hypothetical protein
VVAAAAVEVPAAVAALLVVVVPAVRVVPGLALHVAVTTWSLKVLRRVAAEEAAALARVLPNRAHSSTRPA